MRDIVLVILLFAITFAVAYLVFFQLQRASSLPMPRRIDEEPISVEHETIRATYDEPVTHREALGWIPYWDQAQARRSFEENSDVINHLALFWYGLQADGSIALYPGAVEDQSLLDTARERDVSVFATIANVVPAGGTSIWDPERVDAAIRHEHDRARHITDIVALVSRGGFDGIIIDYEALRPDQREPFTAFIRDLSSALREEGKLLGVVLAAKSETWEAAGAQAQDWHALARYADHVHVMTYEEHWETSPPGPIASLPWLRSVLEYARYRIPADKLFVGIPFYGYEWAAAPPARGLTYQNVANIIQLYEPDVQWDARAGSKFFTYRREGVPATVWFEDADSFRAKLQLLDELHVPNIFFWRLGSEDPAVWDELRQEPVK
jgi:spore germination protein